ncbi:MAG: hypothetical protein HQK65_10610 [Desulfamplus sp.]|nr:hypothetical protein [Desulfamplus sp.]
MIYDTQTSFAGHMGISQARVNKMISTGKIPRHCLKIVSGKQRIIRELAEEHLKANLSTIHKQSNDKSKAKKKAAILNPVEEEIEDKQDEARKQTVSVEEMQSKVKKAGVSQLSLSEAQRIQAQFKAALLKLEYEEKSKALVKREQVDADFFNVARRVRDSILNIPDRIGAEVASNTDIFQVKAILTKSLIQALEELSR